MARKPGGNDSSAEGLCREVVETSSYIWGGGEMGCPEKTLMRRSKVSIVPSETQRLWGLSFPRHAIDKDTLQTN